MMVFASLLLAVSLNGVWSAELRYPPGHGELRRNRGVQVSQWVQPAGGSFDKRFATPVRSAPAPLEDVVHLKMYVQPQADGRVTAFVRNPEYNLGVFIGNRIVAVAGASVQLQRNGSPAIDGRYDAATDTMTFHFQQLRGDFVFHRVVQPAPTPFEYRKPVQDGDGWKTASLAAENIAASRIATIIDTQINSVQPALRAPYIQSLLIARHGKLVLDEYFNGFSANRPHDVRSAGKSVTTLLIGRAIEDGSALSPQTPVYSFLHRYAPFANYDERKERITVGDLMSMRSGYACDDNDDTSPGNESVMQAQTKEPDWYKYTLDLPMAAAPGTRAVYCSADINLLGAVLEEATRRWLPDYFYDRFARPMQFAAYAMWLVPPPIDDAYMAGGDYFRPRDFLKFGELFLEHGNWNGTHVIDDEWLRTLAISRGTIEGGGGDYGYGWHLYTYVVGRKKIQAISAGGNGGQSLFAFPQLDMAVMITAGNYDQYPVWRGFIENLIPEILQAASQS